MNILKGNFSEEVPVKKAMPWAKNMTANLDLCIYFYIHIRVYFFRYSQSIFKYQ